MLVRIDLFITVYGLWETLAAGGEETVVVKPCISGPPAKETARANQRAEVRPNERRGLMERCSSCEEE